MSFSILSILAMSFALVAVVVCLHSILNAKDRTGARIASILFLMVALIFSEIIFLIHHDLCWSIITAILFCGCSVLLIVIPGRDTDADKNKKLKETKQKLEKELKKLQRK